VLKHVFEAVKPDTVLHLQHAGYGGTEASVEEAHELNVMGTINLAATIQRAPSVKRLIFMSSLHVYGGDPMDPAILTEDSRLRPPKTKFGADLAEMEGAINLLGRAGKVAVTTLRVADIVGPNSDETMARYLRMPVVPSIWGFDPRLQFCHESDALEVLKRAALEDIHGLINVAGDGAVYLSQALRLGNRFRLPIAPPLIGPTMSALRGAGVPALEPHHLLALRYGRVIDPSRMVAKFGALGHTTREAVLDLYSMLDVYRAKQAASEEPQERQVAAA
jgi:UDP-glucose 4-epimerase